MVEVTTHYLEMKSRSALVEKDGIDDLTKIDIRVGTIRSVDDVEGSKKLVRLTVDLGDRQRTILAGMKQERENPLGNESRAVGVPFLTLFESRSFHWTSILGANNV